MLQGLSQVIFVVATGKQVLFRQYAIAFKKSGAQVPRTELAEIGPRFDFSIRRSRAAPDEIQTQSMKQPKVEKKKVGCPHSGTCLGALSLLVAKEADIVLDLYERTLFRFVCVACSCHVHLDLRIMCAYGV